MVIESGLVSLLRTILIIVAIYYVVKLLLRYLMPYLLKYVLKRQQEKFYGANTNHSHRRSSPNPPPKEKTEKGRLGDYVDYEEIDD